MTVNNGGLNKVSPRVSFAWLKQINKLNRIQVDCWIWFFLVFDRINDLRGFVSTHAFCIKNSNIISRFPTDSKSFLSPCAQCKNNCVYNTYYSSMYVCVWPHSISTKTNTHTHIFISLLLYNNHVTLLIHGPYYFFSSFSSFHGFDSIGKYLYFVTSDAIPYIIFFSFLSFSRSAADARWCRRRFLTHKSKHCCENVSECVWANGCFGETDLHDWVRMWRMSLYIVYTYVHTTMYTITHAHLHQFVGVYHSTSQVRIDRNVVSNGNALRFIRWQGNCQRPKRWHCIIYINFNCSVLTLVGEWREEKKQKKTKENRSAMYCGLATMMEWRFYGFSGEWKWDSKVNKKKKGRVGANKMWERVRPQHVIKIVIWNIRFKSECVTNTFDKIKITKQLLHKMLQ